MNQKSLPLSHQAAQFHLQITLRSCHTTSRAAEMFGDPPHVKLGGGDGSCALKRAPPVPLFPLIPSSWSGAIEVRAAAATRSNKLGGTGTRGAPHLSPGQGREELASRGQSLGLTGLPRDNSSSTQGTSPAPCSPLHPLGQPQRVSENQEGTVRAGEAPPKSLWSCYPPATNIP